MNNQVSAEQLLTAYGEELLYPLLDAISDELTECEEGHHSPSSQEAAQQALHRTQLCIEWLDELLGEGWRDE